eukprot:CAMPEP_0203753000 /NCGR_PEP_ID=MMETSP0098-20131031/6842_1 /ASSEMBLY_ACC=CAM_ASM_000208 /TAXON_ID=96639 /ORGANISM=" , Strain NY0313808BC1" /LENGTH=276 /DNA_ID=CAMNT_0050643421 /DNA_START=290 /DNA_END=1120 /DNA_ORIENTATION=+
MVILFMLLFKSLGDECETLHQLDSGTIVVQGLESGVPARGFGGAFEGRFELTRWSWMECAEGRLNGRYKDLSTVFLHSPKTGGSVVESALMAKKDVVVNSARGVCHAPLSFFLEKGGVGDVVATVRHPYTRAISAFYYRASEGTAQAESMKAQGFAGFVLDYLLPLHGQKAFWGVDVVFWPQAVWLSSFNGPSVSVKLIRQEDLEHDFELFVGSLRGKGFVVPRAGRFNVGQYPGMCELITSERVLRALNEIYADDFRMLKGVYEPHYLLPGSLCG